MRKEGNGGFNTRSSAIGGLRAGREHRDIEFTERKSALPGAQSSPLRMTFIGATIGRRESFMKIKVVVHEAEEGGFWAEVPAIPGCATQGETFEELLKNLYEAVEGCLSVDVAQPKRGNGDRVLEIVV